MNNQNTIFTLLCLCLSLTAYAQQTADCAENVAATDTTTVVSNTLQAANTLTVNRKLAAGDTLKLIGGQVIELLPGFEADYGSVVEGENGDCVELFAAQFQMDACEVIQSATLGNTNGRIKVTFSRGEPPYSLEWSSGTTSGTATIAGNSSEYYEWMLDGLAAGAYTIRVTDATGDPDRLGLLV